MGIRLAATFLLIGEAAPFAPATFGSFAVLPFLLWILGWPLWGQVVLLAGVTWVGVLVSTRAERYYGHDAKAIVIDEVAGMLVTFLGIGLAPDWRTRVAVLLTGFLLFRILDVIKPFPAGRAQNLPGGRGVVADDLLAGIYANLVLRIVLRLTGWGV
jgi:phosphatidylglycerophosphatase A